MAPLSLIDNNDYVSLKRGSWVDRSCLTRVGCIPEENYENNAVEPSRGPLGSSKDQYSVIHQNPLSTQHGRGEKRRRRIAFAEAVSVREIPHVRDISEDERVDMWWTHNDYLLIRKMMRITVQFMAKGQKFASEDKDFCARGLDVHTRPGGLRNQRHRQRALVSVLRAQEFQRAEAFLDAGYIAELYSECCRSSCDDARIRAIENAKDVRTNLC